MKPGTSGPCAEAFLSRMAAALEPDGDFQLALHHEAGIGLGRVGLAGFGSDATVVWNADRTRCLVMEGELYDTAALERSLSNGDRQPQVPGHAALVLALYERFGEQVLARLNGAFLVAIWDRGLRQLVVFNDRLGLFPAYYARVNGGLLFASGVRALLADERLNRGVDHVAINQFLVFDHLLDDRTLLESVKLLPQASVLAFREGQFTLKPYWTLRYPEVYEPKPESTYIEELLQHLRKAVSRQRPDGRAAGVLLSGGLDSRVLLALLGEESDPASLHTFTFGIPRCDDERFAKETAREVGAPHHFFELKPDWLLSRADQAIRLTDGLGNVVNLHALATLDEESQIARIMYKGFMGDAMLGFALKRRMWADYQPGDRYDVHLGIHAEQGVIGYDRRGQQQLLTDGFRARVGDAVYQAYRDGMDRAGTTQLANQRLYFDLTQRVPRMTINGVEVVRSRAIARLPFCDNDLLDFVLTIPPGYLFERYLTTELLVRHFPGLAKIPVAGPNRPLQACARDLLIQLRELVSWHLGNRRGPARRPYKDYHGWFRTILRKWVEDLLLGSRALDRGYFNPTEVRRLVAEHMAGASHAGKLGALITLELWHRQFLD